MSDRKIKEFPDISSKLTAPTKKSLFERQRAEAEAKRQREEAETAAVYKDFLASFDEEDDSQPAPSRPSLQSSRGNSSSSGPPRRHFGASTGPRTSGPGSLGPPPPSRKRPFDGAFSSSAQNERGVLGFEQGSAGPVDAATAFATSDDEDDVHARDRAAERAAPKPTLHLAQLPPGTSSSRIRQLIPASLKVDEVKLLPSAPLQPGATERKTSSAIVTLAKETPGSEVDSTVNTLQNRYLGWGCYLSISRHLSSAVMGSLAATANLGSANTPLPFGAKPIFNGPGSSLSRAPPPGQGHRGGFAPPSSYGPGTSAYGRAPTAAVQVTPPSDIKQLKLIHKTVESLLSHGPEFEALLMSRPEVQQDEKWAWLWDARSQGGVWYRWRLWEILTGVKRKDLSRSGMPFNNSRGHTLFDGANAPWNPPSQSLRFEFLTRLEDVVSDSSYDSSDDSDDGDDGGAGQRRGNNDGPADAAAEKSYLDPLRRAKLTHLLARLPDSTGRLRKGDVARVAAFAIGHAGAGADEVVDMVVRNVLTPFAICGANPTRTKPAEGDGPDSKDPENQDTSNDATEADSKDRKPAAKEDTSSAQLIGLYIISDILSSSSTSGVRGAWRYRQLFENALRTHHAFERLGRLEKDLGWGRLRAEKWRRSVHNLLSLWEGWCVFPQKSHEAFVASFDHPPLSEEEQAQEKRRGEEKKEAVARKKWRSFKDGPQEENLVAAESKTEEKAVERADGMDGAPTAEDDVDGVLMDEDLDGEPMEEDLDGEPMEEDLDGEPMEEDLDGEPMEEAEENELPENHSADGRVEEPETTEKSDPDGEDMFAD